MWRPGRRILAPFLFHIDANRINSKQARANMNRLERWAADGVIDIQMSGVAHKEAGSGNRGRSQKANQYIFTLQTASTADERRKREAIEQVLFPSGARTEGERNDVMIVADALKWTAILVTSDGGSKRQPGGILGNRQALRGLGVTVMTDGEAVEFVLSKIEDRDRLAREYSDRTGEPLSAWVGCD